MDPSRYRSSLRAAVGASAAPYGYTLTLWTSGAVTTHAHGVPTTFQAMSLMAGAVAAFLATGTFAFGGFKLRIEPETRHLGLWGGFHVISVGLAIALVSMIADAVHSAAVWPIVGFVATATYLLVVAAQFAIAETRAGAQRGST